MTERYLLLQRCEMNKTDEQLAKLQAQKDAAKAKAKEIERKMASVRAKQQAEQRKLDTRKKVLVGAMVLEQVERGEWPRERFTAAMDRFLTRDNERELFDLPPKTGGAD